MRTGRLLAALLAALALLALAAGLAAWDWYPSLKALGRLRRERSEWERKIREHQGLSERLDFPDAREEGILNRTEAELLQALPPLEDGGVWRQACLRAVRQRALEEEIAAALFLSGAGEEPLEAAAADAAVLGSLRHWAASQSPAIGQGFALARDPGRFSWRAVLASPGSSRLHPGSRQGAVIAAAPLPGLLRFINRLAWDESRLEIVRLRLEPGRPLSRAWLVCRSSGLKGGAQPPRAALAPGWELQVDLESPLLLRRIDPLHAAASGRRELPAPDSPW